jgi:hypothetical protein
VLGYACNGYVRVRDAPLLEVVAELAGSAVGERPQDADGELARAGSLHDEIHPLLEKLDQVGKKLRW